MISAQADLVFSTFSFQSKYLWTSGHTFHNIDFQSRGEVIGSFICNRLTASAYFYINSYFTSSSCHLAEFSGSVKLDCNFTADSLSVLTPGSDFQIRTLTINNYLKADGICGQPIQIMPIDFLPSADIIKSSGTITVDYTILTSIQAAGGAVFTANNSIDAGGNSGWTINNSLPRALYWVGGTGNWEDESHWALSGGGPGGNCIPSSLDNVFFDSNSFTQAGQIVTITSSPAI